MEKYYLALLNSVKGIDIEKLAFLLKTFGSIENIFNSSDDELLNAGIKEQQLTFLKKLLIKMPPECMAEICYKNQTDVLTYYDKNYPAELLEINDFPFVLFVKGNLSKKERIAVVGARNSSAYGISIAKDFSSDFAKAGLVVVSGGAKGIDSAAHEGAIAENGETVVVFGSGIDVYYPQTNKKLFDNIVSKNGALVSEYLPGEPPLAQNFPRRNRIICGLSKGVLVVEARKKSGSLITANMAVEYNRDLYCIPGSIYSEGSSGTHNLIKQGAKLVDTPEDILNDFSNLFFEERRGGKKASNSLSVEADKIYQNLIEGKKYTVEEIASITSFAPTMISMALLELEMSFLVSSNTGIYKKLK